MITACAGCAKPMDVCEEIAACIVYCEDCPMPLPPCETCGLENPPQDHDCCDCKYCVDRRAMGLVAEAKS